MNIARRMPFFFYKKTYINQWFKFDYGLARIAHCNDVILNCCKLHDEAGNSRRRAVYYSVERQ